MEKIFNRKSFNFLFGHLWEVELTYRYIFAFKLTLRPQQPDIFPLFATVSLTPVSNFPPVSTGVKLPPVSLIPAANFLPASFTQVTGFNNTSKTSGKICCRCCRCRWYGWCTLTCEYLCEFSKKFETVLGGNSGAGGNWFMKKTRSKKSRDTVPLNVENRKHLENMHNKRLELRNRKIFRLKSRIMFPTRCS